MAFYVDNLYGEAAVAGTVAVASSEQGGVYPAGSVVQLVPGEVMVKARSRIQSGYWQIGSSSNWMSLPQGASIRARGTSDVVNRFGGNCLECHAKAEPQWDLICEQNHGCDPIPLTPVMVKAIQKTDPRCAPVELTEEEIQVLKALQQAGL